MKTLSRLKGKLSQCYAHQKQSPSPPTNSPLTLHMYSSAKHVARQACHMHPLTRSTRAAENLSYCNTVIHPPLLLNPWAVLSHHCGCQASRRHLPPGAGSATERWHDQHHRWRSLCACRARSVHWSHGQSAPHTSGTWHLNNTNWLYFTDNKYTDMLLPKNFYLRKQLKRRICCYFTKQREMTLKAITPGGR